MFPRLYHAHHSLHTEDIPFWLDLARRYPAPILELGCGTGRVIIPLALEGNRVIGIDHDFGMLQILRKNLMNYPLAWAEVVQADFCRFHFSTRFGLILLPCNTYSTLTEQDRLAVLGCVYDALIPGGAFVTSMPNPLLLKHLPRHAEPEVEDVFLHPLDGEPVQVSSEWRHNRGSFTVYWHYDHLFPNGKVERLSTQATHYLTAVEQHRQEFETSGFRDLTYLGDYNGVEYSPSAAQLILLAKRQ